MTQHSWNVRVWGVRGSAPAPFSDRLEYGGNTSCISLEKEDHLLVLDAGTGLAGLGQALVERKEGSRRVDLLLSHLHQDHLQGLVSFQPFYKEDWEIHLYGFPGFAKQLCTVFGPPFWPLSLDGMAASVQFHELVPGQSCSIGNVTVRTAAGDHPGGSLLYRLEMDGKALVYALDCECTAQARDTLHRFAAGADLLIWDATFAPEHLRPGWGHSTWAQGLEVGAAAGVRRLLMTHFSTDYTDDFLHGQETAARRRGNCVFAKEGMRLEV